MAVEFKFPDVGEGITEGEIKKWLVKEGDKIKEHDVLAEVETDKAIVQIPSPASGKILKLYHKEGDTIHVGEVMATIGSPGENIPEKPAQVKQPVVKPAGVVGYLEEAPEEEEFICPVCKIKFPTKDALNEHNAIHKLQKGLRAEAAPSPILAAPATRRVARESGVDLSKIRGTGLGGRVTEEDVRKFAQSAGVHAEHPGVTVVKKYDLYGYVDRIPLKGVRKAMAKRMVESATKIPHVTSMDEADVTELWNLREREKKVAELKGIKLTFLPFIIKSCVHALKEHLYVNSTLDDEHEEIILKKYYNIGLAIDTDDGLIVPVIKGANNKSILQIAQEIQELAEKTRNRTIDLGDLKGGTFTITNYGSIRGNWGTPLINYPEVAILGVGRIFEKLNIKEGKVFVRKILPLSLSFDHRLIDGAYAARFMQTLIEHLEDPDLILIERD